MALYRCFLASLAASSTLAWQTEDPWYMQWTETDRYLASDGQTVRIPLRLASHETILYGSADLTQVLKEFAEEEFTPVSVGGKAAVAVWFNNFTDTDCGPTNKKNPYLETWFSLWVTPKSAPLALPYESPMSYLVADPRALVWVHRVICGSALNDPVPAMGAVSGGREVWGFPKHHVLADIRYDYDGQNGDFVSFSAEHQSKAVISMRVKLPEKSPDVVTTPQEVATPKDACLTPRWVVKQTRYGQAFKATMHTAPWDPNMDQFTVHAEGGDYGSILSSWDFQPALKVHSSDFKIAAMKPAGWLSNTTCQNAKSRKHDLMA